MHFPLVDFMNDVQIGTTGNYIVILVVTLIIYRMHLEKYE